MTGVTGSDDQLARRCADGDSEAFAEIYRRHHQGVYRYCQSILCNPEDARDALQATMEKALGAMSAQRVPGGLRAWLFGIAHNEAVSLASRRARHSGAQPLVGVEADHGGADRDRLEQLIADLAALPLQQRSALVLRELSGLHTEEIATALQISPSAAKQSVYEARVALRQFGEGRDMNCQRVQRKISDGDGREFRARRVKAHLLDCAACRSFQSSIPGCRSDLSMLFAPLGAAAAAKTLAAVSGSSSLPGSEGSTAAAPPPRSPRYRRQAALAGLLAVLGAGAATGLLPRDDPTGGSGATGGSGGPAPVRSERPRAAPAPRERASASRHPSPGRPPSAGQRTPVGLTSPSVAGYSAVHPAALQALGDSGAADDQAGSGSAGGEDRTASGAARTGDGLAFTGLDLGALLLVGVALLGAGLLTRRLGAP